MRSLIVCDLDGTILAKNSNTLSHETEAKIKQLCNAGHIFCIATGRSYIHLKKLFSKIDVPLYFICCDGAVCIYNEETLFSFPISSFPYDNKEKLIAYGKYTAYVSNNQLPFYRKSTTAYSGHVLPLSDLNDAEIFKVAVMNSALKEYPHLTRIYKDSQWQEYVEKDINKGVALKKLQQLLGISPAETFVFGDGYNDVCMTGLGKSFLIGQGAFRLDKHFQFKSPDFLTAISSLNL